MDKHVIDTINQMKAEYQQQINELSKELRGSMGPRSQTGIKRHRVIAQQRTLVELEERLLKKD